MMKKALFLTGLALTSALFISGCQREKDFADPTPTGPFNIILTLDGTRTVNDGISTQWVENDQLAAFYAPAGTEDYSGIRFFSIKDPETGKASGDANPTAEQNDWYLLYPYYNVTSPADREAACIRIGELFQYQSGNNSMAHLAGKTLPLYGVARNVPADETPTVAMHQAATVLAVNVTNEMDEPIEIQIIQLEVPCDIVGRYSIDFSTGEPDYIPSTEKDAALNTAILTQLWSRLRLRLRQFLQIPL